MAGEVTWLIVAVVNQGKMEELEGLAHRATAWAKGNELGVREFTWSVSPETGACTVRTRIATPEAARAHVANFDARFMKTFLACATIQHTLVFCDPPAAVRKSLDQLNSVYMRVKESFTRDSQSSGPSLMS